MDVEALKAMIEATISAASILGGAIAYQTGYAAADAVSRGAPPSILSEEINLGVASGFQWGGPLSAFVLILMGWA